MKKEDVLFFNKITRITPSELVQCKDSLELKRINERSRRKTPQEPLKTIIYASLKTGNEGKIGSKVLLKNFEELEKEKRKQVNFSKANKILVSRIHQIQRDIECRDQTRATEEINVRKMESKRAQVKQRRASCGYNLINLSYDNSDWGNQMKIKNERKMENNSQRAKRLFELMNCDYDILTGKPKKSFFQKLQVN